MRIPFVPITARFPFILLLSFVLSYTADSQSHFYVGPEGTDAIGAYGYSPTSPWRTIQYAVVNSTGDSIVINIASGTYTESVSVTRSLTLDGSGPATIITPPAGNGITIKASNVTIRNLKVASAPLYGISNTGSLSEISLVNVLCDRDSIGARFGNVNGLTVTGCTFSHSRDFGVYVNPATNVVFSGCSAIANGRRGAGSGFKFVSLAGTTTLSNMTADSNRTQGLEIGGGNCRNVTINGGEFKYNGTTNPDDGGGIYVSARSSTVSNIAINGPLTSSNNITAGIYVDGNTSTADSIKGLTIGQSGGTVTLTSNGTSRGTGILIWGNVSNVLITASFSQGNVSTSAGLVIVGSASGANSPSNITIANSIFNSGYTSSAPAITLSYSTFIDTNGVTATNNSWPAAPTVDAMIYDRSDLASLGIVTHTGDIILPVELSQFYTLVSGSSVTLVWSTATEINNYGFEIQRADRPIPPSAPGNWQSIGFVHGFGTSSSPRSYSYVDNPVADGEYLYRLKQIDRDETYSFSPEVEVIIGTNSAASSLSQNFPNPFNPVTSIEFTVPASGRSTLVVYNILGQTVSTLFDGVAEAGTRYRLQFDAAQIPSGLYFYRLDSGSLHIVRKMLVVK